MQTETNHNDSNYISTYIFFVTGLKCEIPALTENTIIVNQTPDNKYEPDTDVQFKCKEGHRLYTEHASVYCQKDGTWDLSIPTCDPQKCGLPPLISNGHFRNREGLQEFAVGKIVQYECEFGYMFAEDGGNTKGTLTCLASGEWEASLPTCTVIVCNEPPTIANGFIATSDGNQFLDQITYGCDPGYELSYPNVHECMESRQWSPEPPTCNAVRCNRPEDILHGVFTGKEDNFVYNDKVTYKCNLGYKLVGQSVSTCLQNATWSGAAPACKPISCGEPDPVENGRLIGRDYTLNNVVRYACSAGFNMEGAKERVCRETGKWTPDAPVCKRVECTTPPTIGNGYFRGNSYLYQDNVTYECEEGFRLEGIGTLTCTENATWSAPAPVCVIILCERPPRVLNAVYLNPFNDRFFRIGRTVQYNCIPGYEMSLNTLNPTGVLECLKTGSWTNELPECNIISCPQPPIIRNGRPVFDAVVYRSIVHYECNEGYSVDGDGVINCQANGTWSGSPTTCELKECKPPDYVLNGELNYKELTPTSVIRYKCNDGYRINGREVRRCLANLTWSDTEPSCEPVNCGVPEPVSNGEIIYEDTIYQSTVTYTCGRGYNRVGDRTRVCGKDGKWLGSAPVCDIVQCDRPSRVISNGRMIGENYSFGSTITYECDPGYYIDGSFNNRTCLETGQWNRPIIVCTAVECPRLSVRNGQTSGNMILL